MELSFSEILRLNRELESTLASPPYSISVLSNIVTSQLNPVLEYQLRVAGIPAVVKSGEYDNIVQDSGTLNQSNAVVVFWELCKLVDGFQYRADLMSSQEIENLVEQTKTQINLCLKNLSSTGLVFFNRFSKRHFQGAHSMRGVYGKVCDELNQFLSTLNAPNVVWVDLDQILATVSLAKSTDWRFFYSSQCLYTVSFFTEYVDALKPTFFSLQGKTKKALIFDCDNTLWKGIVAEDGVDQIQLSSDQSLDGAIFQEVQAIGLQLKKNGVILGLCSKNNAADVDEVFSKREMLIRNEDLTIKKVNWVDKATNLREIARELNIGLDSIVFVDDSSFEAELIRAQVPEVKMLQVPTKLASYPAMMRANLNLFYHHSQSREDLERSKLYSDEQKRQSDQAQFNSIEDYLASLQLKLEISINDASQVARIAQLTQKTNQFNLTTKRYTETEIASFMADPNVQVLAFSLSDRFGNYGLTGVAIVSNDPKNLASEVDTLLMSCRVLGRGVEAAFLDFMIQTVKNLGAKNIHARFDRTKKNDQVADFYEKYGFELKRSDADQKYYELKLAGYEFKKHAAIEVISLST